MAARPYQMKMFFVKHFAPENYVSTRTTRALLHADSMSSLAKQPLTHSSLAIDCKLAKSVTRINRACGAPQTCYPHGRSPNRGDMCTACRWRKYYIGRRLRQAKRMHIWHIRGGAHWQGPESDRWRLLEACWRPQRYAKRNRACGGAQAHYLPRCKHSRCHMCTARRWRQHYIHNFLTVGGTPAHCLGARSSPAEGTIPHQKPQAQKAHGGRHSLPRVHSMSLANISY